MKKDIDIERIKPYHVISIIWIIFVILSLILIINPKVSALTEEEICKNVYFFIVEHLNNDNKFEYTDLELERFKNELGIGENITFYIHFYEIKCKSYGWELPKKIIIPDDYKKAEDIICKTTIDKKILFYEIDSSIPFFNIYIGQEDCDSLKIKRWFLEIEKDGIENYKITGIRLWWWFFPLIFVLIAMFLKSFWHTDKVVKKAEKELFHDI